MNKQANMTTDLTKNQSLVMNTLAQAHGPLSAYTILDELRDQGFRAPLQVYRALDKLVELGLVHRLESLKSFVACQHPLCDGEENEMVLFTICERCGDVDEIVSNTLASAVKGLAQDIEFSLDNSVIELRGLCAGCKGD